MDIGCADKVMINLITDVNEGGVLLQKASLVQRDNYGQIKHDSQFSNDSVKLERFRQMLLLTCAIERAVDIEKQEFEQVVTLMKLQLTPLLLGAIQIYKDGWWKNVHLQ